MRWKFKINNIIYDVPFIAKIVNRNYSRYRLLYLDGSSGWHDIGYIEEFFDKVELSAEFFDLFVK